MSYDIIIRVKLNFFDTIHFEFQTNEKREFDVNLFLLKSKKKKNFFFKCFKGTSKYYYNYV